MDGGHVASAPLPTLRQRTHGSRPIPHRRLAQSRQRNHCRGAVSAGAAGCVAGFRMPGADGVERADEPRGRLRHQRLRRVLFRSRYVVGSGGQGHPHAGGAVCRPRHRGRGAQPGARASLVPRKARPALPGAALFDAGHRPLSDQEHADRNPAHAEGLRGVRAEWLRRCRRTDRAAQSGREFFGGELRSEGGAMEGAVAGDHGAAGGMQSRSLDRAQRQSGINRLQVA